MIKIFNCIICPVSCQIRVKTNNRRKILDITGYKCKKGRKYAVKEIKDPLRTLTTTILVKGGRSSLVSVRTSNPIPKKLILKAMKIINKKTIKAPVKIGKIIIKNILNTECNIIATKNVL